MWAEKKFVDGIDENMLIRINQQVVMYRIAKRKKSFLAEVKKMPSTQPNPPLYM